MPKFEVVGKFKVGDYVQITTPSFWQFDGNFGYIESETKAGWVVKIARGSVGFYPHQLTLIDEEVEARKVLGDAYFE